MQKFYIDTAILIDYYENRNDHLIPLGEFAYRFLVFVKASESIIVISNLAEQEFSKYHPGTDIFEILNPISNIEKITYNLNHVKKARLLSSETSLPFLDSLHVILALESNSILITRDKHFLELEDLIVVRKPEDFIC